MFAFYYGFSFQSSSEPSQVDGPHGTDTNVLKDKLMRLKACLEIVLSTACFKVVASQMHTMLEPCTLQQKAVTGRSVASSMHVNLLLVGSGC